jgi:hypothetical protein
MPGKYETHPPHGSVLRPRGSGIKHCVTFTCSDCGQEILGWVPSFASQPERLGWCDACWQKRQGGEQRKAA